MQRPKFNDDIKRKAAEALVADLVKAGIVSGSHIAHAVDEIVECAQGQLDDGYDLAKALDYRCCWNINAAAVEALDAWSMHARDAQKAAEKVWFEATNPQPPLAMGARVDLGRRGCGEIDDIYAHGFAEYLVRVDGADAGEFAIVKFEDAKPEARA